MASELAEELANEESDVLTSDTSKQRHKIDENIERLTRELAAAQQERSQSAAYGLELLNEKENLQRKLDSIESSYEQAKLELQELREAWNKAVSEQRVSATNVFEKEVQLMNDSDALAHSFSIAKQEIEKELKQTKSLLESTTIEKDRYQTERDELTKRIESIEQERKNLKNELKDIKSREARLFNENSELEEENVGLQKQVSNLRSTQVEFESSKHEIQRLQDALVALNSQLEEMVTLRRITERHMKEALEGLQSEREQKTALRKELDKRNSADPSLINWTSLAALKSSPHLTNLALRGFNSPSHSHHRNASNVTRELEDGGSPNGAFLEHDGLGPGFSDVEQGYDIIHDLEMPSIEGSLFDEVHLTEIKKLQQTLEEKENQRSNLNTKLIEIQHKLESKSRQAEEIDKKLTSMCLLIEQFYNETDVHNKLTSTPTKGSLFSNQKQQQQVVAVGDSVDNNKNITRLITGGDVEVTSTTTTNNENKIDEQTIQSNNTNILKTLDDFDNVYTHLQTLFASFKSYQELVASFSKQAIETRNQVDQLSSLGAGAGGDTLNQSALDSNSRSTLNQSSNGDTSGTENIGQADDVQSLKTMLYKKHEQLKQLRTILKSNKESAEVALKNLKSKYDMEKAIVTETMTKLRLDHKRLSEDAATFASLRSHFSSRIEEYHTEIEELRTKLAASEQEKNTLNSILRMAIEQKVMLTQKLEALEMDRQDHQSAGGKGGLGSRSGGGLRGGGRGAFMRGGRNHNNNNNNLRSQARGAGGQTPTSSGR